MTSLRTLWGIDLNEVRNDFGPALHEALQKRCESYLRSGHMVKNGDTVTLTDTGYFISDAIVSDLMIEEGKR
jgi:oxygen-independent coproporphyrinogen-3 oxidase